MAERQSFSTRNYTERHIPKLRPSKEHITSEGQQLPAKHSRRALAEVEEGPCVVEIQRQGEKLPNTRWACG